MVSIGADMCYTVSYMPHEHIELIRHSWPILFSTSYMCTRVFHKSLFLMRWVRYGMVDFSKHAVRVWVAFRVLDLLLVLQVFSSGTNHDENLSDLSAFLANFELLFGLIIFLDLGIRGPFHSLCILFQG